MVREAKKQLSRASVFFDKFVEPLPHIRHQMELDDFGRDSSGARVNGGKMVQKEVSGLEKNKLRVEMAYKRSAHVVVRAKGAVRHSSKGTTINFSTKRVTGSTKSHGFVEVVRIKNIKHAAFGHFLVVDGDETLADLLRDSLVTTVTVRHAA
jgi:hypothetical protein